MSKEYRGVLSDKKVLFLISGVVAIGTSYLSVGQLSLLSNVDNNVLLIVSSVILFFLISIFGLLFEVLITQSDNVKSIKDNHKEIKSLNKSQQPNTDLADILLKLSKQSDTILEATGRAPIYQFLRDFNVGDSSIEFQSETLSISSYIVFWEKLNDLQKHRVAERKVGLVAKITHSGPIDVWAGDSALALLKLQKEFIENGGKVIRVLIDLESRNGDISKYNNVYEKMKKDGIDVFYLPLDETDDFVHRYDFLVIDIMDCGLSTYVVRWESDTAFRQIVRSKISCYSREESGDIREKVELKKIAECLKNVNYRKDTPLNLKNEASEELLSLLKK